MKKSLYLIAFIAVVIAIASCQSENNKPTDPINNDTINDETEAIAYVPMTTERFVEISDMKDQQGCLQPIYIKGVERAELLAYYIKSYDEKEFETWVDRAFDKMNNSPESKPGAEQVKKFEKIMKLPRCAENTFKFMCIMTDVQLETVGY